jgi:phosphatidylglycerophosphatase A
MPEPITLSDDATLAADAAMPRPASDDTAPSTAAPKRRPTLRFLLSHPAHFIALGAGSGLSPVAPGTAGTLWAWLAYAVLSQWLNPAGWGWVIAAGLPIGWWACTVAARNARLQDPGFIVWDEVIAFWIILWLLTPASGWLQLLAFALFRWLDAAKPGPIGWADQRFKGDGWRGGFGIVFDDLVAAFGTLLILAVGRQIWPGLH